MLNNLKQTAYSQLFISAELEAGKVGEQFLHIFDNKYPNEEYNMHLCRIAEVQGLTIEKFTTILRTCKRAQPNLKVVYLDHFHRFIYNTTNFYQEENKCINIITQLSKELDVIIYLLVQSTKSAKVGDGTVKGVNSILELSTTMIEIEPDQTNPDTHKFFRIHKNRRGEKSKFGESN